MRKTITVIGAAALAAVAVAAVALLAGTGKAQASGSVSPTNWLMITTLANKVNAADPQLAMRMFDKRRSFVKSYRAGGLTATPVLSYTSETQFAADVKAGLISAGSWVMYGLESTTNSPLSEKQDPRRYLHLFSEVAHAHGIKTIVVPGQDLVFVPGSNVHARPGESMSAAYLGTRIPAACANANIFLVEAQAEQDNLSAYDSLVTGAKAQVGTTTIWSGLTTLRNDTASQVYRAWHDTHSLVSGYWMNSSAATLVVAIDALHKIETR